MLLCAIPDHCHPDARRAGGEGAPVGFVRLSVRDAHQGRATALLDRDQALRMYHALGDWLMSHQRTEEDA